MGPVDAFITAGFVSSLIPIPPPAHDPTLAVEIYALHFKSSDSSAKEPLLLLHGHPQNSNIYHGLGPALAKSAGRDIVIADSRGSGQSSVPKVRNLVENNVDEPQPSEDALRSRYSKREMGRDMVHVMCESPWSVVQQGIS